MNEWISVKDRLPPENQRVLIFNLRDSEYAFLDVVRIGFLQYDKWWLYKSYHGNSDNVSVTHWMPLPEAPK